MGLLRQFNLDSYPSLRDNQRHPIKKYQHESPSPDPDKPEQKKAKSKSLTRIPKVGASKRRRIKPYEKS
jgi:hypothetical protein